ncbi:lysozyme inhibitor LprI family protein [Frateuria hangzhouensis]|uniref:lysozyme inhibitor LprI family protein n=1 Tax=Frateuria hangzhouensis TaxID=2995589 RepID=UPI002260F1D0|nr:lysozyme inhibitor LprI family protein [Frateuria sp. STR12]MCX7512787.1 lysozyme inhibitor LprI family protein [Frateuria sp. STR12]
MRSYPIVGLLATIALGVAYGQSPETGAATNQPGIRASYGACIGASGGVTAAMLDCMGDELDYQNLRLNNAYRSLMAQSDDPRQEQLRTAERKWILLRDARCRPAPDSGTAADVSSTSCYVEETARQASKLESALGQR